MKGFNVFLAVLIFLLAATSAVFSYFLFEKRSQLVTGYGYMGEKYEEAARLLDANSGTKLTNKVNAAALRHDKAQDLATLMSEFIDMTKAVTSERDELAKALAAVSSTLEKRDLSAKQFMQLNTFKAAVSSLQRHAADYRKRNDAILNSVSRTAATLGATVTTSQLKSSNYANAYAALDKRVAFWVNRNRTYENNVRNIASALGMSSPRLAESSFASDLTGVVSFARNVRSERDRLRSELAEAKRQIENQKRIIAGKDKEIADLKALCAKKDQEILRLSRVLGLETPRQPMKDGCEAALNLVKSQEKGKVNSVNEKFGFVVVSLGRNTRVQGQFGNRVNNVDPQIVNGAILTVARNMPSGEAEYINKVKIVRLDADCSIAEPIDKKGGKEIEAGDMVYFADDEIARLVKNRK